MPPETVPPEDYAEFRPLMFSIAYRMTGSISDAEDIVQEAFLRLTRVLRGGTTIDSPKAYLATATTRLAISHLRSARVRRESYVGAWLPEPLLADPDPDPAERAEMSDSLSMAFLVLLESLTPTERAVFLLHEVFGYDYKEIAGITGKSETNCRQILARARHHVDDGKPRFDASREQREEVARRFFAATEGGDMTALLELLAPDVVMVGDGGGKAWATAQPISGAERVARLLFGLYRRAPKMGVRVEP
ncbi:MAG TPA: RNA polymerase sigma factor SigJ, partial [Streptosporangiaceae bacterium]|nr:RNA polymerase sigma factor SigJ [Streptosporangiaceae bacterium]